MNRTIKLEKQFKIDAERIDPSTVKLPNTSSLNINNSNLDIYRYYNAFLQILQWQTSFTKQDLFNLDIFKKYGIIKNNGLNSSAL